MKRLFIIGVMILFGAKCHAQIFQVATQLLSDALLEVNASLEVRASRRCSVLLRGAFNPLRSDSFSFQNEAAQISCRMWKSECFMGHYISLDAQNVWFDFGKRVAPSRGNAFSVGVGYGYSWMIKKRVNIAVELSLGFWWIRSRRVLRNEDEFEPDIAYRKRSMKFLPINGGVTIGYMF